ncbi:MAG TPA: hypothetical protein PL070_03140, partial [Flavobacteriales bacterium]|nr:hypothetical protein [Flavobacteriales bacterium]
RNSVLFNEMLLPCAEAARYEPLPRTGNVSGLVMADTVDVLKTATGIRVKMNIGSDQYYFLFDSGHHDLRHFGRKSEAERLDRILYSEHAV